MRLAMGGCILGVLMKKSCVLLLIFFSLLWWLGLGSVGAAQPGAGISGSGLTVEALVTEAVRHHPELEFYRAEVAAARAGRRTAGEWPNPESAGEVGAKRARERGGGSTLGDGVAWSVSVAQPFEWPGKVALRKALANRQIEFAEISLVQFEAALANRVRTLAGRLGSARSRATAAREVAARYRAVLEVLVQRESTGLSPVLEQRLIEASAISLQRRATEADREAQAAQIELNQLRGAPAGEALTLVDSVEPPRKLPPLPELQALALTNNLDLRARRLELEQQGFQVRLAGAERYPQVTLAPFYSSEKAADEERIAGVGVSVPLPLWSQNRGGREAASARERQAQAALEAAARTVERRVAEQALALASCQEEMAHWRPDTPEELREAAELADRHYRLGAVPAATYLEIQSRYLDAIEALQATRVEAVEHGGELELLVGRPLTTGPAR
jgi:cobalt-zinc-cadmium efflux system outer membrane protein